MDIFQIIKDNLPDLPEGTTISDKAIKAIEKEIKAQQGLEFVPKTQYAKKTDRITELESELSDAQGKAADGDTYKEKFDKLQEKYDADIAAKQQEFDAFKSDAESKEAKSAKQAAIRKSLSDAGANPKLIGLLEKEFDIDNIELDGDNVKDWETLLKPVKESYSDIFGKARIEGTPTDNPPTGGGGNNYAAQLEAARKSGNTQEAVRIKTEAAKEGVILI